GMENIVDTDRMLSHHPCKSGTRGNTLQFCRYLEVMKSVIGGVLLSLDAESLSSLIQLLLEKLIPSFCIHYYSLKEVVIHGYVKELHARSKFFTHYNMLFYLICDLRKELLCNLHLFSSEIKKRYEIINLSLSKVNNPYKKAQSPTNRDGGVHLARLHKYSLEKEMTRVGLSLG